jgi:hypothetical protein
MREELKPLIKSCGTPTDPAAETKSIGLQADLPAGRQALELSWFLHATLTTLS